MDRTFEHSFEERSLWPALLIGLGLGTGGLGALGGSLLLSRSELGRALILLSQHALRLIPPMFWVAGLVAIVLWIVVMTRAWGMTVRAGVSETGG